MSPRLLSIVDPIVNYSSLAIARSKAMSEARLLPPTSFGASSPSSRALFQALRLGLYASHHRQLHVPGLF
jgi:hypothetical protein